MQDQCIIDRIRQLAGANSKLNQLLTNQLVMFACVNIADYVLTMYLIIEVYGLNIPYVLYLLCDNGYLLLVVLHDNTIQKLLEKIRFRLQRRYTRHFLDKGIIANNTSLLACFECSIYFEHFQLKIYELCDVNASFLIKSMALILSFVVIVIQTK